MPDAICFHAHASVEKLFKALIARHGTFPPRTHELPALRARLPEPIRADARVAAACTLLQDLYPAARYPKLPMPSVDDARRAFTAAGTIRGVLRVSL